MKMSRTFFVERDTKQVAAKTTIEKAKVHWKSSGFQQLNNCKVNLVE
jgi:hypothetical protein